MLTVRELTELSPGAGIFPCSHIGNLPIKRHAFKSQPLRTKPGRFLKARHGVRRKYPDN
jgi:hypothetical protein